MNRRIYVGAGLVPALNQGDHKGRPYIRLWV